MKRGESGSKKEARLCVNTMHNVALRIDVVQGFRVWARIYAEACFTK